MASAQALPIALHKALASDFFNVLDPGVTVGTISWMNKGFAVCKVTTAGAENRALPVASGFGVYQMLAVVARKLAGTLTVTGASGGSVALPTQGDLAVFVVTDVNGTKTWRLAYLVTSASEAAALGMRTITPAPTQDTAVTLTTAQTLAGILPSNPSGGAITLTLPTAANLVAAISGCKVGYTFDLVIANTNASNAVTVAANGTGGTNVGSSTVRAVAVTSNRRFTVNITNVTPSSEAYSLYPNS